MKTPGFFVTFLMLAGWLFAGKALGDIGPHHFHPPIRARVSMQNADVVVKFTLTKSGSIQADVDGKFDMLFTDKRRQNDSRKILLKVDFPISFVDDQQPQPTNFVTAIDENPVTNVNESQWCVFLPDGNTAENVIGYVWRCEADTMKDPTLHHFAVHYTLNLTKDRGQSPFIYFLRTGAKWDGPIGKEVVKVVIQKGLKANIVSPTGYKPKSQTDDAIVWELVNAKPTEDIQLLIQPESLWGKIKFRF
jgi:hypothetical protein